MRRRCAFGLIRALLAVASVFALGWISVPTAAAVEPVALVEITLDAITPALPTKDGAITLTGRVRNITDQPIDRPRVYFWRNEAPITSREGLDQALASESNDPIGRRLVNDNDFQELFTERAPALAPGKSAGFKLKVDVNQLGLSPTDGIYLMGVHVLQPSSNVAIGRSRIFVPVVKNPPEQPLRLTSVVVLNSRPAMISKGVFADDHLADELGAKGRLTALLKAADVDEVTFAIDPALIEELQAMKAGYEVRQPDGPAVEGPGQAAAEAWLDAFATLKDDHDGYRLLYGSPDLAALTRDGQRAPIRDSVAAGKQITLTSSLPLLIFPPGGAADAATMDAIDALHPKAVLLADTTANGDGPLLAGIPADGKEGPPIVSYGVSASGGGGPGPDPQNTAPQIQQRYLADTWIQAATVSNGSAQGSVRVITTGAQARGDADAVDAPWLKPSTLTDLLDTVPQKWNQKFRYPASARNAELTLGQLNSLSRLTASYQTYGEVLVDNAAVRVAGNSAVARAASSGWRRHDEERRIFLGPQQARLDENLLTKIKISSSAHVSTIAQEDVAFPITVRNELDATSPDSDDNAVKLELVFTSDNTQRLSIKSIDIPVLRAQDSVTEIASVTAKANGTVPVRAQLRTTSGRLVGRPVTIDVKVTQNGTTGWAIAIGAGLVLAGSTALRIRQVAKERAKTGPSGEQSVLTSAPPTDGAGSASGADDEATVIRDPPEAWAAPIDVNSSAGDRTTGYHDV